jgi:co-chaperonin GroES (HSP10)
MPHDDSSVEIEDDRPVLLGKGLHTIEQGTDLDWYFPPIEPEMQVLGNRLLVQLRRAAVKTRSGLFIPDDARESEKWNAQTAKVLQIGPLCFRRQDTLQPWPEGEWVKVGDFVRVPKYGKDQYEIPLSDVPGDNTVIAIFRDLDMIALITGDPLKVKAYI